MGGKKMFEGFREDLKKFALEEAIETALKEEIGRAHV